VTKGYNGRKANYHAKWLRN